MRALGSRGIGGSGGLTEFTVELNCNRATSRLQPLASVGIAVLYGLEGAFASYVLPIVDASRKTRPSRGHGSRP